MSELISGKEAFIAYMEGNEVEWCFADGKWKNWTGTTSWCKDALNDSSYRFRLKPKTITINGVDLPAPFEPKDGDYVYVISDQAENGWIKTKHDYDFGYVFGAWRTEDEIKQVVEVLRSIFNLQ